MKGIVGIAAIIAAGLILFTVVCFAGADWAVRVSRPADLQRQRTKQHAVDACKTITDPTVRERCIDGILGIPRPKEHE